MGPGIREGFLGTYSGHIASLQNSPGRLAQTLEESSLQVWTSGTSGVGVNKDTAVSYYEKGAVVAFLLDARIRRRTGGGSSLDDVMRLAYARYSGERGFTADEFVATASEAVGVDLKGWIQKSVASTEDLDYSEALEWYGLRFAADAPASKAWTLEVIPEATDAQEVNLRALLAPSSSKSEGR